MYRGFKINNIALTSDEYYQGGLNLTSSFREQVSKELEKYLEPDGTLDGGLVEEDWFPQVKVDIFLSHSHADARLAFSLAGWLYHMFGLKCFVDSAIWGHADTLLKKIDDKYCMFPDSSQYDYSKRNKSTSLVHMILAMAIAKLIDRTECLFLLNTPNSVRPTTAIMQSETNSPWLYYEAGLSLLTRKPLSFYRPNSTLVKAKQYSERAINEAINFEFSLLLETKHLKDLDADDLILWKNEYPDQLEQKIHPLDKLYELF